MEFVEQLQQAIDSVVRGDGPGKRLALVALLAEGHVLLEDVPGTGKTSLARAIAESIDGVWKRIQFTPDLLPADVTGSQIFNQRAVDFEFHQGPVFANVVLADEINRASPKTQSALLEVMEERQVTSDGDTMHVPRPFIVIATQNPIEQEGTYRLPEAQLDRFMLRTSLGYLSHETETELLLGVDGAGSVTRLQPVVTSSDVMDLINLTRRIHIAPKVAAYVAELAATTRRHGAVRLGVSTRGSIAMIRAARALALMKNRRYVTPDDVKELIEPVFAHRMLIKPDSEIRGVRAHDVLAEIADDVAAPSAREG